MDNTKRITEIQQQVLALTNELRELVNPTKEELENAAELLWESEAVGGYDNAFDVLCNVVEMREAYRLTLACSTTFEK